MNMQNNYRGDPVMKRCFDTSCRIPAAALAAFLSFALLLTGCAKSGGKTGNGGPGETGQKAESTAPPVPGNAEGQEQRVIVVDAGGASQEESGEAAEEEIGKAPGETGNASESAALAEAGETGAAGGEETAAGDGTGNGAGDGTSGERIISVDLPEPGSAEAFLPDFSPHCTENTDPARLISLSELFLDDHKIDPDSADFKPWYHMNFGDPSGYTEGEAICTFRGTQFRDDPCFGRAVLNERKLESVWSVPSGTLISKGRSWTGSGWTGQPLMRRWPREMKQHMNMADWAKEDDDLVEVIYACLDGNIYFLDLKTGTPTRETLKLGYTFKGAGALDPRGLPLLYVGSGYDSDKGKSRVFVINLLDQTVLHTFGNVDPVSLRGSLSYFDSSALVDADSDTLIYPGENGLLYLIHLNTDYDPEAGTIAINPDHVYKWRYQGKRTGSGSYWLGMEDSAAVFGGYLYIADNGGHLMCLDLNTMHLVWAQDILDDSNGTPVLSVEDGKLYLYISTSFHLGWRSKSTATVPVWKIDAETGEILWTHEYTCHSSDGVSGGVQSTIAVGRDQLSPYVYVTVSKVGGQYSGVLACLDKETGEAVWEHQAGYAWSSPVCVYDKAGHAAVLYCSSDSRMYLLDGKDGTVCDSMDLGGGNVEASPAVWEDLVVVGTRGCKIRGVRLK